ncbi:uncharacterized protein LOC124919633 isoform X2 [Impatiens glandulifera]|uniref:uncharacterized protein LOC124919633 isoform X2 n=1 Tax=Impatiens glandulifera TaxID=253017 RepID=UPI001FB18F57|nr:uncharacterized protein LOC124919633 isoform X2 [Impatiens glandulifera]
MNSFENQNNTYFEKAIPGCLGRVVNLFDLSTGVPGDRLFTDTPNHDVSPLSRNQSYCGGRISRFSNPNEYKVTLSDPRHSSSYGKSNGAPMKMLIANEMSKESDSFPNSSNVVAKLMGLDTLPQEFPLPSPRTCHSRSLSESSLTTWKQKNGYIVQKEYKDIYESWQQQPRRASSGREKQLHSTNEKKMALVRQKFMEAKQLATDEKLRQSKQFQDALDILSSNRELFLRFLQEPNSLLAEHLCDLQSLPPPDETKRITVLRPSKMVDSNKIAGKNNYASLCPPSSWKADENQPTRIVVLKPSSGKLDYIKAEVVSPPFYSPETLQNEEYDNGHRIDDEALVLSSSFSNGYIGDESSFNKSDNEHQIGDSEVMSPIYRHSWDYINKLDSPHSCSSFSHVSHSPDSSVCKEAKKRLSERWATVSSGGNFGGQKLVVQRNSRTLGEMLAISNIKDSVESREEGCSSIVPEPRGSRLNEDDKFVDSPMNLLKSKSVSVSSNVFGERLNVEVCEEIETKNLTRKLSFKEKVSSLFFSRPNRTDKEICNAFQVKDRTPNAGNSFQHDQVIKTQESLSTHLHGSLINDVSSDSLRTRHKWVVTRSEETLRMTKPVLPRNTSDNQEQPSPISAFEASFEHHETTNLDSSANIMRAEGKETSLDKYRLIDKSPPIGSISRVLLSWKDSPTETTASHELENTFHHSSVEDEEEWIFFVQTLLSLAGLNDAVGPSSVFSRWHSSESPLDLSLREKYINLNEKELIMHETNRRKRRSTRKLVFDCVNAALVEITSSYGSHNRNTVDSSARLEDLVWALIKKWRSSEAGFISVEDEDGDSLVVEGMVMEEVAGKDFLEFIRIEIEILVKEIEVNLVEEVVEAVVQELTGM